MGQKVAPQWKGREILDPEDEKDLEVRSAIHEFSSKLPRHEAEEKAHNDYKRDKVIESAAHHLKGLKAAHAVGDIETARKHGICYKLAMDELGHKDLLSPPDEVTDKAKNSSDEIHHFKSHKGDYFTLPKEAEGENQGATD